MTANRRTDLAAEPSLTETSAGRAAGWSRWLPLGFLAIGIVAVVVIDRTVFDLSQFLSFEALRTHRESLTGWVGAHPVSAPVAFVAVYALAVALSVPGAVFLSIAGGFLFGLVWGSVAILIGATAGAVAVFLAAKTALGDRLRRRAGPTVQRMKAGFRDNAFNYLLVLRLVPLFPFFLVNLVPAFLGVPLPTYFWATVLGIIPGVVVYASVGSGLGAVFDRGAVPDVGIIFDPVILGPLIGLSVLALVPVIYKAVRKPRRGQGTGPGTGPGTGDGAVARDVTD